MNSVSLPQDSSSGRHLVFAYGTLKKGQPNFYHFEEKGHGEAKHIGTGRTVVEYPLVVATRWNLPFLLFAPGKGNRVVGDIFEVDDDMFAWMDDFEGHPQVYQRMKAEICADHDTATDTMECWVYFLPKFPDTLFSKTMLTSYDATTLKEHEYKEDEDLVGPDNIQDALFD